MFYFFKHREHKTCFLLYYGLLASINISAFSDLEKATIRKLYIDFDTSMQHGFLPHEYATKLSRKQQREDIPFLRELYATNNFLKKLENLKSNNPTISRKIPKIIHQIWLGSPFPECYKKYQESWQKLHPDWEYHLWTDTDVADFKLINQKTFNTGRTWAEKANVFRYEILERFGGVYVDTDFEALQPLDILHDFYEFYAGIATINRMTLINNAIIGAIPHHPILQSCIANLNKKTYGNDQMSATGTIFFSNIVLDACRNNPNINLSTLGILPPTYLYPAPFAGDKAAVAKYLAPSSLAVHYWATKWQGVDK